MSLILILLVSPDARAQAAVPPRLDAAATQSAAPAPTRIPPGAKLFIEPNEFGLALSAAVLKKHVPVATVTDAETADFAVRTTSSATQEKTGERVTKLILFGGFAGSGRRFEASVTITNRDGVIVFAHNTKKENSQSAAENVAKELKKHVEGR